MKAKLIIIGALFVLFFLLVVIVGFQAADDRKPHFRHNIPFTPNQAPFCDFTAIQTSEYVPPSDPPSTLGTLKLMFVHGTAPLRGLRVGLIEPSAQRPSQSQTSDASGEMMWRLPAGEYRWCVLSRHDVDMVPKHENQETVEIRHDGGQRLSGIRPPPNLSGLFEIGESTPTSFTVKVHCGLITGALPITSDLLHELDLFIDNYPQTPGARQDSTQDWVQSCKVGVGGRFAFENVRPGKYTLDTWWRRGQDYYFTHHLFVLDDDEHEDLGTMAPFSGPATRISIPLRKGSEPYSLPPELNLRPTAKVLFGTTDDLPLDVKVGLFIDFEIGGQQDFYLHGLPGTHWSIQCAHQPKWPATIPQAYPPPYPIAFKVGQRVEFPFTIPAPAPVLDPDVHGVSTLTLTAKGSPPLAYYLLDSQGVALERGSIQTHNYEKDRIQFRIPLKQDKCRFLIHAQQDTRMEVPVPNLFAFESLSAGEAALQLQPGATLEGVVVTSRGTPCKFILLFFRPVGMNEFVYSVNTDEAGRFIMTGLLRDVELEGAYIKERVSTSHDLRGVQLTHTRL